MENHIVLNEPAILDVIVEDKVTSIIVTTDTEGSDELKVKLNKDTYERLILEFGDTSNIRFGGTDNWGKDKQPIYMSKEAGSVEYDGVFVNDLNVQRFGGENNWCECIRLENGALQYTALTENTSPYSRVAYFVHSTTDEVLNSGFNEGRRVSKEWWVTVIQYGYRDEPKEEPEKEMVVVLNRE